MYQYKINCWVPPKSGKDLIKKNEFIKLVNDTILSMKEEYSPEINNIKGSFDEFINKGDGYVMETITIESDTPVQSILECEQKILPLIQQKSPYAKLVGCTQVLSTI